MGAGARKSNRRLARRVNRDLGEGRERLPIGSSEGEAGWENLRINRVGTSESKDTESTEQRMSCLQFDKHSMLCVTPPPLNPPVYPVVHLILCALCVLCGQFPWSCF